MMSETQPLHHPTEPHPQNGNSEAMPIDALRQQLLELREQHGEFTPDQYRQIRRAMRGESLAQSHFVEDLAATLPVQQGNGNSLERDWSTGLSALVAPRFHPLPIPRPPEKVEKAWNFVTGGIVSLLLGKEAVETAGDTLALRKRARGLGQAEALAEIEPQAEGVWQEIPAVFRESVDKYLARQGVEPSSAAPSEKVEVYRRMVEARRKKAVALGQALEVVSQQQENEVTLERVKVQAEKWLIRAKALAEGAKVSAAAAAGPVFGAISGVSKGIAHGLGSVPALGIPLGTGGLAGGIVVTEKAASSLLELSQSSAATPEVAAALGGIWLSVTGSLTLYESIQNLRQPKLKGNE